MFKQLRIVNCIKFSKIWYLIYKSVKSQIQIMQSLEPVDWKLAISHARSLTPGIVKSGSQVCSCCSAPIQKQRIPLCDNTKELSFLGPGFPLYFIFLKYSIIMILLLMLNYTTLTTFWAYGHNISFCSGQEMRFGADNKPIHCTSWMILISRIELSVDSNEKIIRATSFITQLFFLIYIREQLRKYRQYYHQRQQPKISDYSILLKNIPRQPKVKQKVILLFKQAFSQSNIEKIYPIALESPSFNSSQIRKLETKYLNLRRKENKSQRQVEQFKKVQDTFLILLRDRQEKQTIYNLKLQRDQMQCQKVIIIVSTQSQKENLLKIPILNESKISIFGQGAEKIELVPAPQPNEIIWANINVCKKTKVKSIILGWTLFIVLLVIVTLVFYCLLLEKAQQIERAMEMYNDDPKRAEGLKFQALLIVLGSTIAIILFNKLLLSKLLYAITQVEKHKTAAGFELSLSVKYALGLVFTTAILTFLVENIKFHNIYEHDYGVIEEETIMYFFSAFLIPAIWFCNPWLVLKAIKRYWYKESKDITQQEANQITQYPEYNIGKRYAQIIEIVWFTYFYSSLIPIGAPLTFIGSCLFYWVDKYNLLRRSILKQNVSGDLSMKALVMLDITLILKPLGQIIFDMYIRSECSYQSFCLVSIAVIYVFLPKDRLFEKVNGQKFILNPEHYKEVNNSRLLVYSKLNPNKEDYEHLIKYNLEQHQNLQKRLNYNAMDPPSSVIINS